MFSDLQGKVFTDVRRGEAGYDNSDALIFTVSDDEKYALFHQQDCCEDVYIEDICGDLMDLVGTPIVLAEERSESNPEASECGEWTFYTLRTIKGDVTIRFYGESNGYYAIDASLYKMDDNSSSDY